jgi:uncharacterized membrane protein YfcA
MSPLGALLGALGLFTSYYVTMWWSAITKATPRDSALELGTGFVTNFFDTLGIGSFAPTTAAFKFFKLVPDRLIPGTLNVGHTIPTIAEAFIYTAVIAVDPWTLIFMIAAAVAGAYLGSGIVAKWPKRNVQIGMGSALLVAAILFTYRNLPSITAAEPAVRARQRHAGPAGPSSPSARREFRAGRARDARDR